ncbi:MAG TPA: hypothetical protein PKV98_09600 [Burkholderiaceae bacterium]|nr:hypothetical protein [Burkholderiaceae bacterium]
MVCIGISIDVPKLADVVGFHCEAFGSSKTGEPVFCRPPRVDSDIKSHRRNG